MAEDKEWKNQSVEDTLAVFQQVRAEQIALLPRITGEQWNAVHPTVWGPVSLKWIVSKTFQHTADHTHDVMRMALFWDMIIAYQKAQ